MATVTVPSQCMVKIAPKNQFASTIIKSPSSLGSVRSISKSFGLKCSQNFKASMAVYKIKLIGPEGEENEFEASDDTYILDAAESAGVELPYSCRAGACSTCAGKMVSGSVDQSDGSFLDENQMEGDYLLTCVSYPTSDSSPTPNGHCPFLVGHACLGYWVTSLGVGINYGQIANNLPSPSRVALLLQSLNITRVKLYDADPNVLLAFSNSNVDFIIGLGNEYLQNMTDPIKAQNWVQQHLQPHLPQTKITCITVGNEYNPSQVPLDYVLFQPNQGLTDPNTNLNYDNMLYAQIDAVYSAIKAMGHTDIEVRISETGWPSKGDTDEEGATPENARLYNGNLLQRIQEKQGTPAKPSVPIDVYVFALFNEDLKPGPTSERNYGLSTLMVPQFITLDYRVIFQS
ncbi:hypothetical protein GH714_000662 [Hevea brasiliensis]|uniref:Ferredoxin n=1 Tax=Hevea brasiliensis TaxID=3981 RepID=A0A6A6N7J5_HEVBR|nr:hypothetical protein GH714_000662 [Hevea brasiliensis]